MTPISCRSTARTCPWSKASPAISASSSPTLKAGGKESATPPCARDSSRTSTLPLGARPDGPQHRWLVPGLRGEAEVRSFTSNRKNASTSGNMIFRKHANQSVTDVPIAPLSAPRSSFCFLLLLPLLPFTRARKENRPYCRNKRHHLPPVETRRSRRRQIVDRPTRAVLPASHRRTGAGR